MATGLGKTWLSAFDVAQAQSQRTLFVAHREEILRQSRDVFRKIHPDASLGMYTGKQKSPEADVLFAGVQTLSLHLDEFAREEFDYIVIDEFHHAAAPSYRKIIDYFEPHFLLGLTATPERLDGGDLLGLCNENEVFNCNLVQGIEEGLLCPFDYWGIKDCVDFKPIPWRGGRFDTAVLTKAVETEARAQQAFEQWQQRAGSRSLAFCCTMTHADYMARHFESKGVKAVAVHSGSGSAPRHESIELLSVGELQVVFCVDIFNEGLDVPEIDTVLMLRPTESPVIFLQQLGRGLRTSQNKDKLTVIDFIGNHKSFLIKPATLLALARPDARIDSREILDAMLDGTFELPSGCSVDYDLEVVDMLKQLASMHRDSALEGFCRRYYDLQDIRPTAAEAFRAGYNPGAARKKHGSWFEFLADLQLLTEEENACLASAGDFLRGVEKEPITKSYKMVTLRALIRRGGLFSGVPLRELCETSRHIASGDPRLRQDIEGKEITNLLEVDQDAWCRYWRKWPIAAWLGELRDSTAPVWFTLEGDNFVPAFTIKDEYRSVCSAMTAELVEYRLAHYLRSKASVVHGDVACKISHTDGKPILRFDRKKFSHIPTGPTEVVVDGEPYRFDFQKIAVNVATKAGRRGNALHALLRGWFGPDAGLPGTDHRVLLRHVEGGWTLLRESGALVPGSATTIPLYHSYRIACGAFDRQSRDAGTFEPRSLTTGDCLSRDHHFLAYAQGDSMAGGPEPVRSGDLLLFEWADRGHVDRYRNERVLVQYTRGTDDITAALKRLGPEGDLLLSDAGDPPIGAESGMAITARLLRRVDQREYNAIWKHRYERLKRQRIAEVYGDSFNPGKWNSGHVSLEGRVVLFVTLHKSKHMRDGAHYEDRLLGADRLLWSSQSSTTRSGKKGKELLGSPHNGTEIHLWIRARKTDVEFTYCGIGVPAADSGDAPIAITWRLLDPLPPAVEAGFAV